MFGNNTLPLSFTLKMRISSNISIPFMKMVSLINLCKKTKLVCRMLILNINRALALEPLELRSLML